MQTTFLQLFFITLFSATALAVLGDFSPLAYGGALVLAINGGMVGCIVAQYAIWHVKGKLEVSETQKAVN
jgi:hypothetical protein